MTLDGFFKELRVGVRVSDLVLILSVPVVLSAVFLLPERIQTGLILEYGDPSVLDLWSSTFVHMGSSHFINNLVSYCILIVPIYLFSVLAGEKTLFRYVFLSFLFVLPFVISLANLLVFDEGTGAGFSGIGSAFFGLLPVSLFLFVHNRVSDSVDPTHAVVLFLYALGITVLIYSGVLSAVAIFLITVLLTVHYLRQIGIDELKDVLRILFGSMGYNQLVLISGLLFLASPSVLFPQSIAQDGALVNVFSHYMGLVLGFFLPYIYLIYR